ncbi:MAG: HXXEE domain-containing protein [Pseudomonadota bacterium]
MTWRGALDWLVANWVRGAAFILVSEALLFLPLAMSFSLPVLLIFLAGPAYRLHQLEEHTNDRFRRYINEQVLSGTEGLTQADVVWINLPGVWGLNVVALTAAVLLEDAAWGICAIWLIAINALSHVMMALARRELNPGVITSAFVFAPLAAAAFALIPARLDQHALGLGVSVLIRAAIVVNLVRRVRQAA